jgi:hypothetical protein
MAKPNYAFAKRQRDLAKKQKQEEKRQKKAAARAGQPEEGSTEEAGAQPSGDSAAAQTVPK